MARRLICLIWVLCLLIAGRSASADPVPIVNPGFENPATGFLSVPLGWSLNGDVSVWNITASPLGFWTAPAPEGNQVGTFVGVGVIGPASASQVVGVLQRQVIYRLSGYVGHPNGYGASRGTLYFAELWAGPNLLARKQGTGPDGRFERFEVTFDSRESPFVGLPLRIVIGGNQAQTSFDDIRLEVTTTNAAPTADAGDNQSVRLGVPVYLDGSRSFDDNTVTEQLQYAWTFVSVPEGSAVVLEGWNTRTPSFVPDLPGSYLLQLVVTDQDTLSSSPSQVTISENPPPVASAGIDQLVLVGIMVTLAGSGVDPDGDTLTYSWELVEKPTGSGSQISNPMAADATFVPDRPGTYVAQLTVSDFVGPGKPARTLITATTTADSAESQLQAASTQIISLPADAVSTRGNQTALNRFLINATVALQAGDLVGALHQLEQAMARTDGCALRGAADGNGGGRDWLVTCEAQDLVYPLLRNASIAIASR